MRTATVICLGILTLSLFSGCTTASGAATGAVAGGLLGAGIGAIAGDPAAGALIGTGVGMGGGAIIGHENEQSRAEEGYHYDNAWGTSGRWERGGPPPAPAPVSPPPCPPEPRPDPCGTTAYEPPVSYDEPPPLYGDPWTSSLTARRLR